MPITVVLGFCRVWLRRIENVKHPPKSQRPSVWYDPAPQSDQASANRVIHFARVIAEDFCGVMQGVEAIVHTLDVDGGPISSGTAHLAGSFSDTGPWLLSALQV